jgi:hypothetical protein
MPMATSGHNGNNETLIGRSSSIGLSFYDILKESKSEITHSRTPIQMIIPRDERHLNSYYQYVNVSGLGSEQRFIKNSFNLTTTNVSLYIELKLTTNASLGVGKNNGYLIVLKLGYMPIINATHADYSSFKTHMFKCVSLFYLLEH